MFRWEKCIIRSAVYTFVLFVCEYFIVLATNNCIVLYNSQKLLRVHSSVLIQTRNALIIAVRLKISKVRIISLDTMFHRKLINNNYSL